jgi:hypothetical protein
MTEADDHLRNVPRRRRRAAPEPEPENEPKRLPLVTQGGRGHAPGQASPSIDDAIRAARRGTRSIWTPIG